MEGCASFLYKPQGQGETQTAVEDTPRYQHQVHKWASRSEQPPLPHQVTADMAFLFSPEGPTHCNLLEKACKSDLKDTRRPQARGNVCLFGLCAQTKRD